MAADSLHTDQQLFAAIAEGDQQAFETIFHYYNARLSPVVARIVRSEHEAQEIIQEVFLRLWMHRAELPAIQNPAGWLHTVASNLALSSLRRTARDAIRRQLTTSDPSDEEDPGTQLDSKWLSASVEAAIQQLPSARREVFRLSRQEGKTRREIADQLGISESTVKNQLTSALRFIQDYLDKQEGINLPITILLLVLLKNL